MGSAATDGAGTKAERKAFNSLLGPLLGSPPASVPDIADLLWGPMARGNAVRLR
jgi:phospholipid/cholesterol/gamma-HCH transport system substrate-binding protein